jgi:hypothetical protein
MKLEPRRRSIAVLVSLCAALGTACGGRDYSWYCDRLNDTPSRWTFSSDPHPGGDLWLPVPLRFDVRTPQPCGDACTCTISNWTYEKYQGGDSDFGFYRGERCRAAFACTWPSGSLSAGLIADGNSMTAEGTEQTSTLQVELVLYAQAVQP